MIPTWVILTLISAFILGFKDIFLKKILNAKVKKSHIIFEEYFVMFVLVTLIFFAQIDFNSFQTMWYYYLAKAIFMGTFLTLFFPLLEKHEISKVAPLMNASPVILLLLSTIFLSESVTWVQFTGIIIILLATYVLEVDIHHHHKKRSHRHYWSWLKKLDWKTFGIVLAMLISISFVAIMDKLIFLNNVNVYTNLFYTGAILSLMLAIYFIYKRKFFFTLRDIHKNPQILLVSILAFLSTVAVLFAIAIPAAMVSLIVPLKRTSTLFSSLFGGLLFHERHLVKKIISVIAMLGGILLIVL